MGSDASEASIAGFAVGMVKSEGLSVALARFAPGVGAAVAVGSGIATAGTAATAVAGGAGALVGGAAVAATGEPADNGLPVAEGASAGAA